MRSNSQVGFKQWVLPLTAVVGGLVTYMSAKITRAVGDVGVPSFWLGLVVPAPSVGEGGLSSKTATKLGRPNYGRNGRNAQIMGCDSRNWEI